MPIEETVRAYCPKCDKQTRCIVKGEYKNRLDDDDAGIWELLHHYILECGGCEEVFFHKKTYFSEDMEHYYDAHGNEKCDIPPREYSFPERNFQYEEPWHKKIADVDLVLHDLFIDALKARNAKLDVLAAIGLRVCFDRFCELSGVEIDISFAQKLNKLATDGVIGGPEHDLLEVLIDASNAAAHRGWRPGEALDALFQIIETVMRRQLILSEEVNKFKRNIPKRGDR